MGQWLRDQRARGNRLKQWRRRLLDQAVPGWSELKNRPAAAFEDRVRALKTHRDAYGAWPNHRADDADVKSLGEWLTNTRVNASELEPGRRALLDEQVPGWNEGHREAWFRIAGEVAEFHRQHGQAPATCAREDFERRLGRWLSDQRAGRNLTPEREAHLDKVLPGWRTGRQSWPPSRMERKLSTRPE